MGTEPISSSKHLQELRLFAAMLSEIQMCPAIGWPCGKHHRISLQLAVTCSHQAAMGKAPLSDPPSVWVDRRMSQAVTTQLKGGHHTLPHCHQVAGNSLLMAQEGMTNQKEACL